MNKRITSLLLCFVMVFAMLATAVPAFAEPSGIRRSPITIKADKTTAKPGDTITYQAIYRPGRKTANTLELNAGDSG